MVVVYLDENPFGILEISRSGPDRGRKVYPAVPGDVCCLYDSEIELSEKTGQQSLGCMGEVHVDILHLLLVYLGSQSGGALKRSAPGNCLGLREVFVYVVSAGRTGDDPDLIRLFNAVELSGALGYGSRHRLGGPRICKAAQRDHRPVGNVGSRLFSAYDRYSSRIHSE